VQAKQTKPDPLRFQNTATIQHSPCQQAFPGFSNASPFRQALHNVVFATPASRPHHPHQPLAHPLSSSGKKLDISTFILRQALLTIIHDPIHQRPRRSSWSRRTGAETDCRADLSAILS
jgi:hypothetical protein